MPDVGQDPESQNHSDQGSKALDTAPHAREHTERIAGSLRSVEDIPEQTDSMDELRAANQELRASIIELQRREARFRSLIDTTQDAVVLIDASARIVELNPAAERMFGYGWRELEGQKVNLLMAEPYRSEHDGYIQRYEAGGEPRAIGRIRTLTAQRKSGEPFPIELSVTRVAVDEEVRYAAFIRDISEKAALQEQIIKGEKLAAIGSTAAMFAHEVGNPLNAMYMNAQLLRRRLARDDVQEPKRQAYLDAVMSEITRLRHLLDEFRSLSRPQRFRFTRTDMAALTREVLGVLEPQCDAGAVRIALDMPAALPATMADSDKLKQVLLNLCKNALEAMDGGGTLRVNVQQQEEHVMVQVIDTGGGIPDGIDVFEPFESTKAEGTGLGLAIARQIVQAHHGTLRYESRMGQGTTFTLLLPIESAMAARDGA